jgi:hypothetical protein
MHQDPATDLDHYPKFGYLMTPEDWAHIEEMKDREWVGDDGNVYTARTYDQKRYDKSVKVEDRTEEEESRRDQIPEFEVISEPIEVGDTRLPGGAKSIIKLAEKNGWRTAAFYSRGPRLHSAHGTLLGISDWVQVKMVLDDGDRRAIGFWCDAKFSTAWLARIDFKARKYVGLGMHNSDGLKAYIRGE